uniref:DUF7866 domain-containing protein n=1 Tax=Kalanchoe fedtschenkoi TaxID=63787 RepID=A0A7N0ZSH3_KALFE
MSSLTAALLLLLSLLSGNISHRLVSGYSPNPDLEQELVPLIEDGMGMKMVLNLSASSRRKLNSFQTCAVCTCCGGAKRLCVASPCCYSIKCNVPNRPFGFCSFTPKTCNCFGCHV